MEINVVLLSHRVEFLPLFRDEAITADVIILEEPPNDNLFQFFDNKIKNEEYVRSLDTSFPLYTYFLSDMLKHLYTIGKKIFQVEPYLEIIQKIQSAIQNGTFDEMIKEKEIEKIRNAEKNAFGAFIDYQETFMSGNFDKLVLATINFSKADAERFVLRDKLRLEAILNLLKEIEKDDSDVKVVIEAGSIHTKIPENLDRMLEMDYVTTVNLKNKASKLLGIEEVKNPGTQLTELFIKKENVSDAEMRLLSARSLVYISKVSPEEMLPDEKNKFPHLVEEYKITREVSTMSYERCKEEFMSIWKEKYRA